MAAQPTPPRGRVPPVNQPSHAQVEAVGRDIGRADPAVSRPTPAGCTRAAPAATWGNGVAGTAACGDGSVTFRQLGESGGTACTAAVGDLPAAKPTAPSQRILAERSNLR